MKKQIPRRLVRAPIFTCTALSLSAFLTGCGGVNITPVSSSGLYFDTVVTVTLYDYPGSSKSILDECMNMCERYDNLLSSSVSGSDVWNINHADVFPVEISDDTAYVLSTALEYCELSDGKLDITLGQVSELWDFSSQAQSDSPSLPDERKICDALTHVNYKNIILEQNERSNFQVTLLDPDADIELGFIAKGYIADRLKDYLEEQGVKSALINLGGNVLVLGNKPDGSEFTIGIQKPFSDMGESITTVSINNKTVVSSGVYERYFYVNDKLYHHILNSDTGYPIASNVLGVSIITNKSIDADALSTLCFILGPDKGIELIENTPDTEVMFILNDYEIIYSSGW